jgi:hypothetical protein
MTSVDIIIRIMMSFLFEPRAPRIRGQKEIAHGIFRIPRSRRLLPFNRLGAPARPLALAAVGQRSMLARTKALVGPRGGAGWHRRTRCPSSWSGEVYN